MARHRTVTTARSEEEIRLAALAAVAGKSKAFRPAREHRAVVALTKNAEMLAEIEREVRVVMDEERAA